MPFICALAWLSTPGRYSTWPQHHQLRLAPPVLPVERASTRSTPCTSNLDFSFQILHQSKGIRVNVFLGLWCLVRIFGFMKRTISTSAYVISLITSNHFYHCSLLDSEIRIRIVIHRVYICSVVLLHYCYHSESCRVTNPTELNWRCQVSSLPATCRSFIGYHVVPPRSAVF